MRNQIGSIQQSHLRILEPPQQSLAVAIMVENSFKTYQKRKVPSRVRGFYCSGFGTNRSARFLSPTRSFHDLLGCALCCCCFGSLLCFGHGFGFPRFVLGPAAGRTTLRTEVAPWHDHLQPARIGGSTFSWGSTSHTNAQPLHLGQPEGVQQYQHLDLQPQHSLQKLQPQHSQQHHLQPQHSQHHLQPQHSQHQPHSHPGSAGRAQQQHWEQEWGAFEAAPVSWVRMLPWVLLFWVGVLVWALPGASAQRLGSGGQDPAQTSPT